MFSDNYARFDIEIKDALAQATPPSVQEVYEILEKSKHAPISFEDVARLLEMGEYKDTKHQFDIIRKFTYAEFRGNGNTLKNIAPIYLSSRCIDKCGYCNYSSERKDVERTRLNVQQLKEEMKYVLSEGNKVVEFTLASDPFFTHEKLAQYISLSKEILGNENGSGILLCSDYMEDYELLKQAGLWGMVQWDETLDLEMFEKWHKNSPRKSNFKERIDNHDRAIQAGLQVATGCLFGLSDYRYDTLMQIAKARYLGEEYGVKPFVFGTPRLKSIAGQAVESENLVNDRQYELALMVYKIAEPKIARWLQTRETLEMNLRNIVAGDVYTYKCGDVKPGGYKVNVHSVSSCKGGQFGVNELAKEQFESELSAIGFKVNYAWLA